MYIETSMLGVSGLALVRYSLVSVRREPHPQPHLRFRRQNYYIFLNYANTTPFLALFFLTKAKEPPQLSSQKLRGNHEIRHKNFGVSMIFRQKKFAEYKYLLYLCPEFQGETWVIFTINHTAQMPTDAGSK